MNDLWPFLPTIVMTIGGGIVGFYFAWREREEDKAAKARRAARRQRKSA